MRKIEIGHSDSPMMPSLLSGEKQNLLFYSGGIVTQIKWENVICEGNSWFLVLCDSCLDTQEIYPSVSLCRELRNNSIYLINLLSDAVKLIITEYPGFLDFQGFLPLSSFMFTDSGVLILPRRVDSIIDFLMLEPEREKNRNVWNRCLVYDKARPAVWLCSLVYYAVAGYAPFYEENARETGKCIPLSVLCNSDSALLQFIDKVLGMTIKQQYRISDGFLYFSENISRFAVSVETLPDPVTSSRMEEYMKKRKSDSAFHSFFRRKGSVIIAVSIAAAILIYIAVWGISKSLEKPVTYSMDRCQIVQFYYDAQNTLNASDIGVPFAKGCRCPAELQITTLYVVKQTRLSYEGSNPVIDVQQWVKDGMGPIPQSSIVFGYTDLELTELKDGTVKATARLFTSAEDQENEGDAFNNDSPEMTAVSEYSVEEIFSFTDKKGYWQISGVDTNISLVCIHNIDTYPAVKSSPMTDNFQERFLS